MDEAKAVAAGYGERAPVNQEIPTENARNGEIPKIQTPLFGTTRHPALSGLVIQTFLSLPLCRLKTFISDALIEDSFRPIIARLALS
ncbi:hypothetical protein F7R02_25275 [Xanthomonas cissicola]|nr:hypothetical protein F7R02_25275 [Xanthomonas cissicola]